MEVMRASEHSVVERSLPKSSITEEAIRGIVSKWSEAKFTRSNRLSSLMKIERIDSQTTLCATIKSRVCLISQRVESRPGRVRAADNLNMPVKEDAEATLQKITPLNIEACPNCNGKRAILCRTCNGSGIVRCRPCGGRGEVQVTKQEYETKTVTDPWDGGMRSQTEMVTKYVWERCHHCGGSGTVVCSVDQCYNGSIPCSTCQATGEMTKVNIVEKQYTFLVARSFCDDKGVVTSYSFLEKEEMYKKPLLKKRYDGKVDENDFSQQAFLLAAEELKSKTNQANQALRHGKMVVSEEVSWQELTVSTTPLHTIVYSFQDQSDYVLHVYGDDNRLHMTTEHIDASLVAVKYVAGIAAVLAIIGFFAFLFNQSAQTSGASPSAQTSNSHENTQGSTESDPDLSDVTIDSPKAISQMDRSTVQGKINDLLARFGFIFTKKSARDKYTDLSWYHPQKGKSSEEIIALISADARVGSYWKELIARRTEIDNQGKQSNAAETSIQALNLPSVESISGMDYSTAQHHIHEMMAFFGFAFGKDDDIKEEFKDFPWYNPDPKLESAQAITLIGRNSTAKPIFRALTGRRNALREDIYAAIQTAIREASEAETEAKNSNDATLLDGKFSGNA